MTTVPRATARTASEAVAEQIRARIATGGLKPGDMLPSETALLAEFGVARPTMREALRILESDGLVRVVRGVNGGAQVREPDVSTLARRTGLYLQMQGVHLSDLLAALQVLQPGAVAMAAASATPEQVTALRAQVEAVAAAPDVTTFTDEATAFLHCLVQACGNRTLELLSALLHQLLQGEARAVAGQHAPAGGGALDEEFRAWCLDQYGRLIDCIEAGDADGARQLWAEHLERVPPAIDAASTLVIYQPNRPGRRSGRGGPRG